MNDYISSPSKDFAKRFLGKREIHTCNSSLKKESIEFLTDIIEFLFPHFSEKMYYTPEDVTAKLQLIERNLVLLIKMVNENNNARSIANAFVSNIPSVHDKLWLDAEAIYQGDPAAESIDEIILAYPGFMAIAIYRLAHEIYKSNVPIIPRILSEYAHQITGIDIHPGAEIDCPFFIDHGTGIVIGETTQIGRNVKVYQGVTLGALSVDKALSKTKRHPTIQDNVIIYSQAVILGGETVIGKNSIIGGNSWVTQSVPPDSVVYSKMEMKVRSSENYFESMEFII